jgi:hypothetical protein
MKQQKKKEIQEKEEQLNKLKDSDGNISSFNMFYDGSPILKQASILTN